MIRQWSKTGVLHGSPSQGVLHDMQFHCGLAQLAAQLCQLLHIKPRIVRQNGCLGVCKLRMQSYNFLRLRCFRNHTFFLNFANLSSNKTIPVYFSVFATTVSSTLTPGPMVDARAMLFMYLPLLVAGL